MKLDPRTVLTLYRAELKMALRDRRTLFFSIILPILVMPVMMFASHFVQQKREGELAAMTHRLAVVGYEAKTARGWIVSALASADEQQPRSETVEKKRAPLFEIREVEHANVETALALGDLSLYVLAEKSDATNREDASDADIESALPGVPRLTVVYRGDRDTSLNAAQALRRRLLAVRGDERARLLLERDFPIRLRDVGRVIEVDVASEGQVTGLALGRVLTLFLLMFVLMGGAVIATDSLAGEKERGTLETLLATAAGRIEIIAAKSLLTFTSAVVITAIQAVNFLLYIVLEIIPTPGNLAAAVTPATAAWLFVLYLPVIAFVSSALLVTSGWARSYKEAQLYFTPVMLIGLVPALAPLMPGVRLRSAIVLVPVANIAVAVKEVLVGAPDWPLIGLAWVVTAAAAAGLAWFTARMLRTERLIVAVHVSREEIVGGPELFPRRVLRAFAVMWAVGWTVTLYFPENILAQALSKIGVVFVGGSLFLIRFYRLDLRAALALRAVKPGVWLGVLIGVPGCLLTAVGLVRIVRLFRLMPIESLERMHQVLMPPDASILHLLLLIGLLPGIGEEIAFRGVLLHGLRKRLPPVPLALVVGFIFALFHMDLFRLMPVMFLGIQLTAITLITGSIFPAMLWHALYNGLFVAMARVDFPIGEPGWILHVVGLALIALAFWIFWRCRTPYPDLRPWRSRVSRS